MASDILQTMQVVDKCVGNGHVFVRPIIPVKFH